MTIQKHILVVKSYVLKQILFFGVLCYSFSLSAQSITDIQSYIDSAETLKEIKPNEALEFGFKAKSLAENIGNENLVAESLQKIAIIHRILGNLEEAEDAINKALSYPINDYALISEMNNTKGVILKQMSQFDKALVCYSKTLKIQQYLNNKKGEARTYNNIGRIYEAMEQFDLAMFYYRKALKIYKTLDISKSTGITLQNIGHIYRAHNNLDSALVYFNLALPLYQRENNQTLIAYAYRSIASVTTNKSQAINYLTKSITISQNTNSQTDLAKGYIELGELYYHSKDFTESISLLKKGIDVLSKKKHNNTTRNALKMLYASYDSIGDYKNAYNYQSFYYQLQDSIKSNENVRAMQEYESNIKLKEKQNENAIQQIEIKNTNEKLRIEHQQNIYFLIGVVILALLLLIVILQVIRQKKNNKILKYQKSEIEKRDKEKEVLIREIHHRVKNNLQIISSLLKLDQRKTDNADAKLILNKSTQRIAAIAYIHEKLYQQNDLTDVDLEDYLFDIAENLLLSFDKLKLIDLNIKANINNVHADVAIHLGMLTAELITNSIKHGFVDSQSDFKINLEAIEKDGFVYFSFTDNGPNKIDFNSLEKPKSFGMNLIKSTIKKMNGELINSTNSSVGFKLMFKFKVNAEN